MARAIDADDFIEKLDLLGTHQYVLTKNQVKFLLMEQPTISLAKQEWIRTKDRLPTEEDSTSGMVIAVENDKERRVKPWHWDIVVKYANEFTHWTPLPEPPERDDE